VSQDGNGSGGYVMTQSFEERNLNALRGWLPAWVQNTHRNYPQVLEEFQYEDMSVDSLPRPKPGTPAVIIGSGPSLDANAPLLKDWPHPVFSTMSNAKNCLAAGRMPDYITLFDAGRCGLDHMSGVDWDGATMLTHPAVHADVLPAWQWPKRYFIMWHDNFQWFELITPLAFSEVRVYPDKKPANIRIAVKNAGCTANANIQLAAWLGYDPLFLVGVDFGFPDGRLRCVKCEPSVPWAPADKPRDMRGPEGWDIAQPPTLEDVGKPTVVAPNGIVTTETQIEYMICMFTVQIRRKMQLFNCGTGILEDRDIPRADFKEVVDRGGQGFEGQYAEAEAIRERCLAVFDRLSFVQPEGDADGEDSGDGTVADGGGGSAEVDDPERRDEGAALAGLIQRVDRNSRGGRA